METPLQVSVVIVSYDRLHDLCSTLDGLKKYLVEPRSEIVVVDNASHEPVVETMARQFPTVSVISNSTNEGFGKACNAGARQARGEYLLFANSDLVLRGNPVPEMVRALESDPHVGVVGLTLLNPDGSAQPSGFRFPSLWLRMLQLTGLKSLLLKIVPALRTSSSGLQPDFVTGAFFMIRKDLFEAVGGFDEDYFMYVEDADLGFRVRNSGHTSILLPSTDVVHLGRHYEDPALGFVFRHMNIGQILFYRKHYGVVRLRILALVSSSAFLARWCLASLLLQSRPHKDLFWDMVRLYIDALMGQFPTGRRSA